MNLFLNLILLLVLLSVILYFIATLDLVPVKFKNAIGVLVGAGLLVWIIFALTGHGVYPLLR